MRDVSETSDFDRVDLPVTGMSCSACVRRVERSLNRLDGVHASVNLATESAVVLCDRASATPEGLVQAVQDAGSDAELPEEQVDAGARHDDAADSRLRLNVAGLIASAFTVTGYVPRLRSRRWERAYATAAVPIVLWGGAPFQTRSWRACR